MTSPIEINCDDCAKWHEQKYKQCPKCLNMFVTTAEKIQIEKTQLLTIIEKYLNDDFTTGAAKKRAEINAHQIYAVNNIDYRGSGLYSSYMLIYFNTKKNYFNKRHTNKQQFRDILIMFKCCEHVLMEKLYNYFIEKINNKFNIKLDDPEIYICGIDNHKMFEIKSPQKNNTKDLYAELKQKYKNISTFEYFYLNIRAVDKTYMNPVDEKGNRIISPNDSLNIYNLNILLSGDDITELFPQLKNKNFYDDILYGGYESPKFADFGAFLQIYRRILSDELLIAQLNNNSIPPSYESTVKK